MFYCRQHKVENLLPTGLFQPLQLPTQIWADISMDFVNGLPKVHDKFVLFEIVNPFSNYPHFIPLSHPYTVVSVAHAFNIFFCLHGFLESIVSDKYSIFASTFWKELFRLSDTKLAFSCTYCYRL